jgi:hypothetical protein
MTLHTVNQCSSNTKQLFSFNHSQHLFNCPFHILLAYILTMGMNMKIVPNYQRQEEQSDKNESVFINTCIWIGQICSRQQIWKVSCTLKNLKKLSSLKICKSMLIQHQTALFFQSFATPFQLSVSHFVSIYLDILLKVSNVFIFSVVVYIAQETWNYFLYI